MYTDIMYMLGLVNHWSATIASSACLGLTYFVRKKVLEFQQICTLPWRAAPYAAANDM